MQAITFDSIDWERLLKAVRHHTDCPWVLLYIERWLKAPLQMDDGTIMPRNGGEAAGRLISPLLANVFLHYAFDRWMVRIFPHIPFERYADDAICHCKSAEEARHPGVRLPTASRPAGWYYIRRKRKWCTAWI